MQQHIYNRERESHFSSERNWFCAEDGGHTNCRILLHRTQQHMRDIREREMGKTRKTENDEKTQFEFNYRKFLIDRFALHAVAEMFFCECRVYMWNFDYDES